MTGKASALVAGLIAAGTGGTAIYDLIKAKGYDHDDVMEMIASNPVNARKFIRSIDPDVKVISTPKQLDSFYKNVLLDEHGTIKATVTKAIMNDSLSNGNNAFAYPGKKDNYIITPSSANPIVLKHELGHIADFRDIVQRGLTPESEYKMDSIVESYKNLLWKPSFEQNIIRRENKAWDNVNDDSQERKDIENTALNSYHKGFHKNRSSMLGGLSGMIVGDILASRLEKSVNPVVRSLFGAGGFLLGSLPGALI